MKKLSIFENLNNSVFEAGIGTPNENDFVKAIKNRNYITFYYSRDDDGVLAGPRFVEPYCYGYRKLKNGQTRYYLRAWMIRNTALDYNFKKKGISSKYKLFYCFFITIYRQITTRLRKCVHCIL